jgi:hypothetical protein
VEINLKRSVVWGVAGALAVFGSAWLFAGHRISAIAGSQVNLYDEPIDGRVIKVLRRGDVTAVVGCKDVKHYIVPVVLVDGQRAYLQEGDYRLVRKAVWEVGDGPISFSCP